MRRIFAAAGVVVLMSSVCYGQEVTPEVMKGTKALLFTFDGLSTLRANSFEGGAGLKYYLDERTAIRGILQLTKASQDNVANPGPGQVGDDGEGSGTTIGVGAALERHLSMARVSPYFGAGFGFSTSSVENTPAAIAAAPGPPTTVTTKNGTQAINGVGFTGGTTFGGYGLFGFEFFLTKEVSFSAEYRLGFTNLSPKDTEVTTVAGATTTTITTKNGSRGLLGLASTGVFTMAVYF